MNGPILVVDDDWDVRETIAELLRSEGYLAETAADGLEALLRLAALPVPALVFMDLIMPRMDGRTLLQRMRAERRLRAVPVCVLTAELQTPGPGNVQVLRKPVDIEDLLNVVVRYCRPRSRAAAWVPNAHGLV